MKSSDKIIPFKDRLSQKQVALKRKSPRTVQINLGKVCNQACKHCHVDAGPNRTEAISEHTVKRFISVLKNSVEKEDSQIKILDITGGAPEMNPYFCTIVEAARKLDLDIIDRCNLTILTEPGYEYLAKFLSDNHVNIVASLPCYSSKNVDLQRGRGVFDRSIRGLNMLNDLGFGFNDKFKRLDLVYNPLGADLPPEQSALEKDYKERLKADFDITFNSLYAITNIPISRFARYLEKRGELEFYYNLLDQNFNVETVDNLMCTDHVSVSYEGDLYDCDFNQMEDLKITNGETKSLWNIDTFQDLQELKISTAKHCYGCTAGCGSSCGGTVV